MQLQRIQKIRPIHVWEEIVGRLEKVVEFRSGTIVNVAGMQYLLPNFPKESLKKLQQYRNYTVGILRTDKGYAIRLVTKTSRARQETCANRRVSGHQGGGCEWIHFA